MSACFAMSGTLAAIFSFEASKKWIIREGRKGTSSTGSGAPIASGWANWRGFLKWVSWVGLGAGTLAEAQDAGSAVLRRLRGAQTAPEEGPSN